MIVQVVNNSRIRVVFFKHRREIYYLQDLTVKIKGSFSEFSSFVFTKNNKAIKAGWFFGLKY